MDEMAEMAEMAEMTEETEDIEGDIEELSREMKDLCILMEEKQLRLRKLLTQKPVAGNSIPKELSSEDITRYSRQLILPDFGLGAQLKLKNASFLIVGMGGLGCPAAQYLVAAGCGRIGLVDYDEVEFSNLHRQVLHTETRIGMAKVESAHEALRGVNSNCQINTYELLLNSENALELIGSYDVILDCTDNVASRYLLNDACVISKKPLISGSALQMDGQLTVYHYGDDGPCYRCLFPVPPPPETVTNCGDGGVLGAVTGVIGSLQAMEAIKLATGTGDILAGRLLLFDGMRSTFRNVTLRLRRQDCEICSDSPIITRLINYEQFCGTRASDKHFALKLLNADERISVEDYEALQSKPHLLIDVRSKAEFEICHLPNSCNIPIKNILDDQYSETMGPELAKNKYPIIFLCRRGNDSQIAVQHIRNKYPNHLGIRDIIGGLHDWHKKIDKDFPYY